MAGITASSRKARPVIGGGSADLLASMELFDGDSHLLLLKAGIESD